MTTQKTLKRRVRARMTRTGESYTAARRQILATRGDPVPGPAPESMGGAVASLPMPSIARASSEEAVLARTGRTRSDWFAMLEGWGAAERPHPEIARWLSTEHGVQGWWAQELTVAFERAIGRRVVGQRPDGFRVTASKSVGAPVDVLFDTVVGVEHRRLWLPDVELRLRTSARPRTARFDVDGGSTRLAIGFAAKDDARSSVALSHERLPDAASAAAWKSTWRARLAGLERLLGEDA